MDLAVVASDDLFAFATRSTKLQCHLVPSGHDELVDVSVLRCVSGKVWWTIEVGKLNLWIHNMVHDCPSGSGTSTELQQLNMSNVHGDFDSYAGWKKIASKNITKTNSTQWSINWGLGSSWMVRVILIEMEQHCTMVRFSSRIWRRWLTYVDVLSTIVNDQRGMLYYPQEPSCSQCRWQDMMQ